MDGIGADGAGERPSVLGGAYALALGASVLESLRDAEPFRLVADPDHRSVELGKAAESPQLMRIS